jgi:hypothetical protein
MPQSTNLNKNPYYDDFSDSKNFYKVLFKPGVTVQTRELTTLQSILQDQVEKLGSAFFKKNSVVVPGAFAYDASFYAVEVESTYKGIDVETYFDKLVGLTLTGKISQVTAKVEKVLTRSDSSRSNTTFYIKYQSSSTSDFSLSTFSDGEELVVNQDINLSTGAILSGNSVAKTISPVSGSSTSVGSAAKISAGVYFVRGFLVNVERDLIILDQYSNTPSYRVGLNIQEQIIDSSQDDSLNDNAQGFSNYAAPGADRLKINLTLIKKKLDDYNDEDFIELFRVESGLLINIAPQTDNTFLTDVLARRTFDESGNYYVNPFKLESLESLNDNLGNGGLYTQGETTSIGVEASEDIGVIKVSSGKAYVKGYEIPSNTTLLAFDKPRTTKLVESSSSSFNVGNLLRINNVKNIPNVGLTTTLNLPLYDQRLSGGSASGNEVGLARVYDFSSHITSYVNNSSQFNLNLFDIQVYSKIISDSSLSTIGIGSFVKGSNSGATAFVKDKSGQSLTLYQVAGTFIKNDSLIVNGVLSSVSVGTFTNYSIEDVKSVSDGSFTADTVLSKEILLTGPFTLSVGSGIGTITSNNGAAFASNLKVTDVITYSQIGFTSSVYARITGINTTKTSITLGTVSTVPYVCTGNLGVTTTLQSISCIKPQILQNDDPSLTARLNNQNIADVKFDNSNIYVKVFYQSVTKTSTTINLPSLSGTNYVYASFDEGNYSITNADGSLENLSLSTFTITNGGKNASFTGLSATAGPCKVLTTQIKSKVTQKFKKLSVCNSLVISKTKYTTPQNAGLTYDPIYGLRVDDDQISLNVPDVVQVHGVFESSTTSNPVLPSISFLNLNSPSGISDDLIVGELVIGETSGAVAIYVSKETSSEINLVYKNGNFVLGEPISFSQTGYTAIVSSISAGDRNIVDEFVLDNGQRSHFYDFSRLIRKNGSREPFGRLNIIFDNFTFDATDDGDLIASNSYPSTLSKKLIPSFDGLRNTDIIDIRPRVTNYDPGSSIRSPFEFISRDFYTAKNNASQILSPNENFVFDYEFYLPRKDKVTLSKNGDLSISFGTPSETPIEPTVSPEVLDIATIVASPYVYDMRSDVKIILKDNKRYTMSDLRSLESRVSNLEYYTSLSLLESSTQNLLISDENGLNRFKSGIFVDEFTNYEMSDVNNLNYNADIVNNSLSAVKEQEKINLSLYSSDNLTPFSNIQISDTNSSNVKIVNNLLSLSFTETTQTKQPFASKVVNVNPFNIITWSGVVNLSPEKDSWTVVRRQTINRRGSGATQITISNTQIPFIRSRNISFQVGRLKPNTRFKVLFDKKDLTSNTLKSNVFPKLLEIDSNVGSFQIGETVTCTGSDSKIKSKFRICSPNHKTGPINNPTSVFVKNPYNPSSGISSQYGSQSTFLNIDTETLSREDITGLWGKISVGDTLKGLTSNAIARVSDNKLITNEEGYLLGGIWIDESDTFKTGQTPVDFVVQNPTPKVPGEVEDSSGSSTYVTEGTLTTITTNTWSDPLAQSFIVREDNGIVPTSVDVYFYTKDTTIPIELQIREVSLGTPGGTAAIVPGLRKTLSPSEINISNDASVSTTFTFDKLVRLPAGEYAIVLIADSDAYNVWVSELGSEDISTRNLPAANKIFITTQPSLGVLFKSQNGSTWVPSPLEDLKFTLKKAKFSTSGGTARFYNSTDATRTVENNLPNNPITAISTSGTPNSGRHILVFHPKHGMHSANSKVEITGVESDVLPTTLQVSYANTSTGPISVANTSSFATFEGLNVSTLNPGYIKISDEIIKYEGVGVGQLLNITRGSYGTVPQSYNVGEFIYKYEFNNVSLARINTQHDVLSTPAPTSNAYYVQVSAGSSFTQTKTGGGSDVYASRDKKFSEIQLNDDFVSVPNGSQVSASVRTISSTSINGTEVAYVDNGYQTIGINTNNLFDSPKMVASRVNEIQNLNSTNFVGNRSFTLDLNLETSDENVSPLIKLDQAYVFGSIYNIDQPIGISSYASDSRVNSNTDDPNSFVHITKRVDLQQSAISLKVLLTSYRHVSSDIRVLYKIFTNSSSDSDQIWHLFPGYDNLDVNGNIIDSNNNNGRSDSNVRSSLNNEYLEYTFTADNLPAFTGFQIKVIGSGTNQAYSPIIKDLRVIAIQ